MLLAAVRAFIERHAMLHPGAKVIVAVSGGADSMALLSILYQLRDVYRLWLAVAHVNHQLRGAEAEQDAAFVEGYAARLGLPFHFARVDVKAAQRAAGWSPQQAARQLRYRFLLALCQSLAATHVALGHTADDQAETLLLRLVRGGSPASLAGMPAVRLPFIRPLLGVYRSELVAYLRAHGIPWREDSSNAQRTCLRNCIRLDLIPLLRQYQPQILRRLNDLAEMVRAEQAVLTQQVAHLAPRVLHRKYKGLLTLSVTPFSRAPVALQRHLVRHALAILDPAAAAVDFAHTERLRHFVLHGPAGKRMGLPGGVWAEHHRTTVVLWQPRRLPSPSLQASLPVPGSVVLPELDAVLDVRVVEACPALSHTPPWQAYVDAAAVRAPLRVRFPQSGDRFHPLGAPEPLKLKDFFINSKVPRAERPYVPLVVSEHAIVWVVGYRVAEPYKVRPDTRRMLHFCYRPPVSTAC